MPLHSPATRGGCIGTLEVRLREFLRSFFFYGMNILGSYRLGQWSLAVRSVFSCAGVCARVSTTRQAYLPAADQSIHHAEKRE